MMIWPTRACAAGSEHKSGTPGALEACEACEACKAPILTRFQDARRQPWPDPRCGRMYSARYGGTTCTSMSALTAYSLRGHFGATWGIEHQYVWYRSKKGAVTDTLDWPGLTRGALWLSRTDSRSTLRGRLITGHMHTQRPEVISAAAEYMGTTCQLPDCYGTSYSEGSVTGHGDKKGPVWRANEGLAAET
jgi:hypothetical protein